MKFFVRNLSENGEMLFSLEFRVLYMNADNFQTPLYRPNAKTV